MKSSPRARSLRITVKTDATVVVTIPRRIPKYFADAFVKSKSDWITDKVSYFKKLAAINPIQTKSSSRTDYLKYKEQARAIATAKVTYFNQFYKFNVGAISIRNQKTRWGSCSRKGNLNFNYKIALIPEHLVDYLVVHELCHIGQFNHSQKFWDLVGLTIPNYKKEQGGVEEDSVVNVK